MAKLPVKILLSVAVITTGLVVIFVAANRRTETPNIPTFASTFATPTPFPSVNSETTTTIEAPDGKVILAVTQKIVGEGINEAFSVQDKTGSQTEIYSEVVPTGNNLSVPYNTFSPDDKYLFLKESTPSQTYYYVLATNGKPVTGSQNTLEISSLFYAKYTDFTITDVTGWGGINILVVNTNNKDGSQGPSFWFEVPGGGFTRLSTRFN